MGTTIVVGIALGLAGLGIGLAVAVVTARRRDGRSGDLVAEMRRIADEQRRLTEGALDTALDHVLQANREVLDGERRLTTAALDGRKELIDQQLAAMATQLGGVSDLVRELDLGRRESFGELAGELQRQHEGVNKLVENTQQLREALGNTKVRGQWGERMAEDVLSLAGFLENVNYRKQSTLGAAAGGGRPDFTFLLPNNLVLHMDVKFPLDNYVRYLEAGSELERKSCRDQFLRDVRDRVKELTTRGYLDAGDETVDCLLLFIPNEQVYAFIQENDRQVLDDALRNKIVLCSPLTLYAVLAVVRQAVDNFRLEKTSDEILSHLGEFSKQWERYVLQLEKVQQRFENVAKEYEALMTTRHRALQRPLDKIDTLRCEALALDDDNQDAEIRPFTLDAGTA